MHDNISLPGLINVGKVCASQTIGHISLELGPDALDGLRWNHERPVLDIEHSPDSLLCIVFIIFAAKARNDVLIRNKHHLMKLFRAHDLGRCKLSGARCRLNYEIVGAFLVIHVQSYVTLRLNINLAEKVLPFRFIFAGRVTSVPLTPRLDAVVHAVVDKALFAHGQTVPTNEFDLRRIIVVPWHSVDS